MVILYVETNFPVGIAKGQDSVAADLLARTPSSVRLVMPGICYMEALSVLKSEKKQRRKFRSELETQIREVGRDVVSRPARVLVPRLEDANIRLERLQNQVEDRLCLALDDLAKKAALIDLTAEMVQQSLRLGVLDDRTDNLILSCIVAHARSHPSERKAFLSANSTDFEQSAVGEILSDVGVKYFRQAGDFLGWLGRLQSS